MKPDYHNGPLPGGWIRELDPKTNHPFWVDTVAKPPRSIWVHPYEDEQFLREHPDVRERLARESRPSDQPPPYSPRRHSFSGTPSTSGLTVPEEANAIRTSHSQPETPSVAQSQQRRGFFGKLKDKAIGTKEEREARRRAEEERQRRLAELRRRRQEEQWAAYNQYPRYGGAPYGEPYGGGYGQPVYAAPTSDPYGRRGRGGGFGGGGIALPLLAGAAGGLLLGDILDGGFGGGGFGGGGFDGGGFDGGGFDGGGFDGGGGGFF